MTISIILSTGKLSLSKDYRVMVEEEKKERGTRPSKRKTYERSDTYATCKEYSSAELDRMIIENEEFDEIEKQREQELVERENEQLKMGSKEKKYSKFRESHKCQTDRNITIAFLDDEFDEEEEEKHLANPVYSFPHNKTLSTAHTSGLQSFDADKDKMSKSLNVGKSSKGTNMQLEKLMLPIIHEDSKYGARSSGVSKPSKV